MLAAAPPNAEHATRSLGRCVAPAITAIVSRRRIVTTALARAYCLIEPNDASTISGNVTAGSVPRSVA
jgi:hypothetical protein